MKINVKHVARLANLPLSEEEVIKFESQLEETLTSIDKLNEVETEGVGITSQVTGLENVKDEDSPLPSLSQSDALANAPHTHNGLFVVKAILEDGTI